MLLLQRKLRGVQRERDKLRQGAARWEWERQAKELKARVERLQRFRDACWREEATSADMLAARRRAAERADAVLGSEMEAGQGWWLQQCMGDQWHAQGAVAYAHSCASTAEQVQRLTLRPTSPAPIHDRSPPQCSPHASCGCTLLARAAPTHRSALPRTTSPCTSAGSGTSSGGGSRWACSGASSLAAQPCLSGHPAAVHALPPAGADCT